MKFTLLKLIFTTLVLMCETKVAVAATYYVSATTGSDSFTATQAKSLSTPWKTIQNAATNMVPGDTCLIESGTYRETVTVPASGSGTNAFITFKADTGQTVQISGAEIATGWTLESPNIYYAPMSWTMGVRNQVFQGGTMKPEARWPNAGSKFPFQDSSIYPSPDWVYVTTSGTSGGTWWLTGTSLPTRADSYWNGATVNIMAGDGWYIQVATVTGYTAATQMLTTTYAATNTGAYSVNPGNEYYLSGVKGELDSDGEWFCDSAHSRLYFYSSTGPPSNVEAKKRDYAFNLSGRSFIALVGLTFQGCTIQSNSSSANCVFDSLTMRYLGHSVTRPSSDGIALRNGYVLRNSDLGYDSSAMIQLAGGNITLVNNNLHDSGYMPVMEMIYTPASGGGNLISHNSIHGAGRGLMSFPGTQAIVEFNDLYGGMRMASDGGAMHTNGPSNGSIVRYNLIHDIQGARNHSGNSAQGFYLDNYNTGWVVHHNIIWNINGSAIQVNNRQNFNMFFNNSCVSATSAALQTAFTSDAVPASWNTVEEASGTYFFNNLFCSLAPSGVTWTQSRFRGNFFTTGTNTSNLYVDLSGSNFQLCGSSPAIDQGVVIPGITDGYSGAMPDIGALEYGQTDWRGSCGYHVTPPSPTPTYSYPTMVFPNQVRDSSFESGSLSLDWTAIPSGNICLLNASSWTDGRVRTGNYDAVISNTGGEISQTVTGLQPNKRYNMYVATKATNISSTAVAFGVRNFGCPTLSGSVVLSDTNWRMNNLSFVTGTGWTTAQVFASASITSGTVYVDDFGVQLSQAPAELKQPLLDFSFNETSGATAADHGTLALNGSLCGTTSGTNANGWTTGTYGNALNLNGVDGYVVTQGMPTPQDATITFWAKSAGATWNNGCLISKRPSYVFLPQSGTTGVTFTVYVNGGATSWNNSWTPPAGFDITQWHHYAGVISPETGGVSVVTQLFVDGVQRDARSVSSPAVMVSDTTNTLYIGRDPTAGRFLQGAIDDVRVYDYAMSATEINWVMTVDPTRLFYLRLDDGAGATRASDSAGTANGALFNVAATDWTTAGKIGGALHLNGTNSYLVCSALPTPADVTVSLWAKSDNTTWNGGCLLSKRPSFLFNTQAGGTGVSFVVWVNGGATSWSVNWTPPANFDITQWHQYVGVISPETGGVSAVTQLYVDGTPRAAWSASSAAVMVSDTTNTLVIGADPGSGLYLKGSLDDIRMYSRALSANDIIELNQETNQPPYAPAPLVTLAGSNPLTIEAGASYTDPGATASDTTDGALTPQIVVNTVLANQPGAYIVTWAATDSLSLTGAATRTVTVVDTTPPTIAVPANIIVNAPTASGVACVFSTSATDFVSGSVSTTNNPASGTAFPIGVTTVTTTASDAAGNSASKTFTVTVTPPFGVQEKSPPQLAIVGGTVALTVKPSVAGRLYQVQVSDDLSSGSWQDVGAVQTGSGGNLVISIPYDSTVTRRFYRLRLN